MRPHGAGKPIHPGLVAVLAGALAAINCAALAGTSSATLARVADAASAPKPPAEATVRRLRSRSGFPTPRYGAQVPGTEIAGTRVFANEQDGFALAGEGGQTFPVRTANGGKTWTINGPQFHVDAADGAEAVSSVGIVSSQEEFAYGASVADVTTNAGHTWWEAFLGESVTAVVPARRGLIAFVQQSVSNRHPNPIVTWQYVSTDGGRHWHYSTSFAATA